MGRHGEFERLHNFRDLGGYRGADGATVRWGQLYRSDSLSKLAGGDWHRFLALGVRTVIDLRRPREIDTQGRVPEHDGLAYHNLCIEHRPYDPAELDPEAGIARYHANRYAQIAEDGAQEIRQALDILASQTSAPAVIHCSTGTDRTGLLAALVLALLGVAEPDIVADFTARSPNQGQARAEIMRLFLADLTARHGSIRGYAIDQLGIDDEHITALRTQHLSG